MTKYNSYKRIKKNKKKKKKIWTPEEDRLLIKFVNQLGVVKWSIIAKNIEGRQGKQCRERWYNHLDPQIKKTQWTKAEKWTLFLLHNLYGNKWAVFSRIIRGRTDNNIKNHWNTIMKRHESQLKTKLNKIVKSRSFGSMNELNQLLIRKIMRGEGVRESGKKPQRNYKQFIIDNGLVDFIEEIEKGAQRKNQQKDF